MGKGKVKGITIQIGGDTVGLDKALDGVNKKAGTTQSQLKEVERLLKLDPTNTKLLEQRHRLLGQAIEETKGKLDLLNQANDSVKGSMKNYDEWKRAYEPIQSQIDATNKKLKELKQQQAEMKDCGEVDSDSYEALTEQIQEASKELRDLKKQKKEIDDQFGNPISQEAFDSLQREIIETENKMKSLQQASSKNLDKLGDSVDDVQKKMKDLGEAATKVKDKADKVAETFEPATKAVLGVAAAAAATVPATQELREELARLDTNAMENAVAVDTVRAAWKTFAVQSGDTGASVEAVSNLLQAGFTESNLQKAVEGLAGAAQRFPDTLKVESLADGLQETLATQSATGAFAELMERLGMDVEAFNTALGECTDQEQKLDLAMQVLADAGLADSYDAWKTNNEEMVRNKEASLEMELVMAEFAETVLPYVTRAIEMVTKLMEKFNGLPEPVKFAIAALALLVGGIAPAASAISGVSSLIAKLSGGDLPGLASALSGVGTKTLPALSSAFSSVFGFIAANPVVLLIGAIVGLVAWFATKGEEIKEILQKVDDFLQSIFAQDWTEVFGPVLGGALNGFLDKIKGIWDSAKQIFDGIIDFVQGTFTGDWDKAWTGIKEIFSGIFDGLEAILKTPINSVIKLINRAISGVDWLIDGVNKIPGVELKKIGQIPLLAEGGEVIRGNAVVGENGPELMTVLGDRTVVTPMTNHYYNHTRNMGGVAISVYGAPGQDVRELAELVSEELQNLLEQEEEGIR